MVPGGRAVSYERDTHVASSLRDLMWGSQPTGIGSSASLGFADYDRYRGTPPFKKTPTPLGGRTHSLAKLRSW
jgi:hypothetical protein